MRLYAFPMIFSTSRIRLRSAGSILLLIVLVRADDDEPDKEFPQSFDLT